MLELGRRLNAVGIAVGWVGCAIMDAGGEVLKFMGDTVMGIFRSDRPEVDVDMRQRALAAAMRTVQEIAALDAPDRPLKVGIALHVGEVCTAMSGPTSGSISR